MTNGRFSRTRSKTAPEDVLCLSWSFHKRERQNTLRVVFSYTALNRPDGLNHLSVISCMFVAARLVTNELSAACDKSGCNLARTRVDYLNGEPLDAFLNNIVLLDADVEIREPLRFSSVTVLGNLQSENIAGIPASSLVNRLTTSALHRPLVVTSQVSSPSLTAAVVDGVPFNKEELLLLQGNQNLKCKFRENVSSCFMASV